MRETRQIDNENRRQQPMDENSCTRRACPRWMLIGASCHDWRCPDDLDIVATCNKTCGRVDDSGEVIFDTEAIGFTEHSWVADSLARHASRTTREPTKPHRSL